MLTVAFGRLMDAATASTRSALPMRRAAVACMARAGGAPRVAPQLLAASACERATVCSAERRKQGAARRPSRPELITLVLAAGGPSHLHKCLHTSRAVLARRLDVTFLARHGLVDSWGGGARTAAA